MANNYPPNPKVGKLVMIVNQTGTAVPSARILHNTLGGTPTFNRLGSGEYLMTLTGEFPLYKTVVLWGAVAETSGVLYNCTVFSPNQITINKPNFLDGITDLPIQIEVFNDYEEPAS